MEKWRAKWQALQPRERLMLIAMAAVFFALALFMVSVAIRDGFATRAAQIESYREALVYLEDNQSRYLKDRMATEAMRERLLRADPKVVNSFTVMASELGFDVTVTPKDAHRASATDESGAEEQEIEIVIRSVEHNVLLEYLWRISRSNAPIYIRRLDIRQAGARMNNPSETMLTASLTVVSYRLKE